MMYKLININQLKNCLQLDAELHIYKQVPPIKNREKKHVK